MTNKWLYPCGCAASFGSPDYCPEHGDPLLARRADSQSKDVIPATNPPSTGATDADRYAYNLDQFRVENDRLREELRRQYEYAAGLSQENARMRKWMVDARKALDAGLGL